MALVLFATEWNDTLFPERLEIDPRTAGTGAIVGWVQPTGPSRSDETK